jgi:hypothetical protein
MRVWPVMDTDVIAWAGTFAPDLTLLPMAASDLRSELMP